MIEHTQTSPRAPHHSRALLAALLLPALATGCSRADPAEQAIHDARAAMARVTVAGASAFPDADARAKVYRDVLKTLQPIGDSSGGGLQSAASSIASRAHAGLGEIAAENAAQLESRFVNDLSIARSVLDTWVGQNSFAAALDAYDPTSELQALDGEIAARSHEANQAQTERTRVEAQLSKLLADAKIIQEDAKALRDADTAARAGFADMSQTARSDALEASAAQRRQADQYESAAAALLAEAEQLRPQVAEKESQRQRLARQAELHQKAKEEITRRRADNQAQAAAARNEAAEFATRLDTLLTALASSRDALAAPTQDAMKSYGLAVSAAKKARAGAAREGQAALSAAAGSYEEARADALATRARSLVGYARLMGDAALAKPALPNASRYAETASVLEKEANDAVEESRQAYKSARDLFKGVSGGGADAQARLKAIDAALAKLAGEPVEPPPAEETPAEPAPAPPADEPPPEAEKPAESPGG